jgi:prepilin-type N-terminal cleavage/methylation domain-containing protein
MLIKRSNKNGFSLLELLLAIGILGIIAVFALSISHSTKNLAKTNDTKNRMREIKRAALDYYRGHRDLPAPAGTNEVPVATSALNLEQKHRLDAWGRYFHYKQSQHAVHSSRTDITGISVDGKDVAGVIVSGGPDQEVETLNSSSPYTTAGDDIVLPISLHEQAMAIVMNDLEVFQSKVQALDKMFAGVDNNSGGGLDENGCAPAFGCPETGTTNDPNCSTATLDAITPSYSFCGNTVNTAAELIVDYYELGDTILLDPWLNEYAWGDASTYGNSDVRFHKFFSTGPNGIAGDSDDIVP